MKRAVPSTNTILTLAKNLNKTPRTGHKSLSFPVRTVTHMKASLIFSIPMICRMKRISFMTANFDLSVTLVPQQKICIKLCNVIFKYNIILYNK